MDSIFELQSRLTSQLATSYFGRPLHLFQGLGSTQDEARQLARAGATHGTLVWALEQTQGRGRMDRSWVSRPGTGLWFSLVLRPEGSPDAAALVSLGAGVAVAHALRPSSADLVRLKWPNDVLLHGRKLAGILAEGEIRDGALRWVILGIGLNLDPGPAGFPAAIAADAAALVELAGAPLDPTTLMASLLAELEVACEMALKDPEALRRAWLELSDTIGRQVRAQLAGGVIEGKATDLDPDGSLVVETADGRQSRVRAGEVLHLQPGGLAET